MSSRLSVTLPDEVMEKIEALARASGKSKSEVVRDLLASVGLRARKDPKERREVRERAAAFRARQKEPVDVVALIHEQREERDRQIEEALRGREK
jgi:metal-responsive CopG/Arc/MetJ family transcriptional regulator